MIIVLYRHVIIASQNPKVRQIAGRYISLLKSIIGHCYIHIARHRKITAIRPVVDCDVPITTGHGFSSS